MVLSRLWYVLLGLAVAVALYVVFIAVGEYDRQSARALKEGLASDSQTVAWALKIDARHRLDALLAGSVDPALQQALALAAASREGKVPDKARADAKKALAAIHEALPADWRDDVLWAVDRDGRVVANLGYDAAAGDEDFEAGGYPAVNDALHGWLRDDMWLLGGKLYVVVTRPVEFDVTQRPAGAIVGLTEVNGKFAQDLSNRTRTSVAFYVDGRKVAAGAAEGFETDKLDAVVNDLKNVDDKAYHDGRTEARMLEADLGVMYTRLPGDIWELGGGVAVARAKTTLAGPMGFLSGADDKDKANVPWLLLAGVVLAAAILGIGLTTIEHSLPLRELVTQADRLKVGAMDGLHVARFRGAYRLAAQGINEGIERAIEKAGGVTRKPADLESILGPVPAQPAMSAFSFPTAPEENAPAVPAALATAASPGPFSGSPFASPPSTPFTSTPFAAPPGAPFTSTPFAAPPGAPFTSTPFASPPSTPFTSTPFHAGPPPSTAGPAPTPSAASAPMPGKAPPFPGPAVKPPLPAAALRGAPPPSGLKGPPPSGSTLVSAVSARGGPPPPLPKLHGAGGGGDDEDATTIAQIPADVLAQATGAGVGVGASAGNLPDENADWRVVYEDFIRIKKQCGEPTDGLTFEKFSLTLRKNRDQLVDKHGCKRVRFSVYVKEGRASLKATPMKD
jgi:hypothetical protein